MFAKQIQLTELKIGGLGIVVEIDETKLGKRKYNRGHRVEGVWIVCGVERTKEKRYFAIEVNNRDAPTISNIIDKYVARGSIIYTDKWKAYLKACSQLGYVHLTENLSKKFKDPITGVHTNTIDGCNNTLKTFIKPRNRVKEYISDY